MKCAKLNGTVHLYGQGRIELGVGGEGNIHTCPVYFEKKEGSKGPGGERKKPKDLRTEATKKKKESKNRHSFQTGDAEGKNS